ncbi:MAG: hypothetical protein PHX51_04665 [Clostridia bacterium]|nr:hypothetical protein [Clostridia bacterium]
MKAKNILFIVLVVVFCTLMVYTGIKKFTTYNDFVMMDDYALVKAEENLNYNGSALLEKGKLYRFEVLDVSAYSALTVGTAVVYFDGEAYVPGVISEASEELSYTITTYGDKTTKRYFGLIGGIYAEKANGFDVFTNFLCSDMGFVFVLIVPSILIMGILVWQLAVSIKKGKATLESNLKKPE